jgi:hypothetical protein
MANWPDGEPRLGPNDMGSAGGVKDGHAVRRADGYSNSDTAALGWLPAGAAEGKGGVGTGWTKIGPNSSAWSTAKTGPYTTGMQKSKKR